MPGVKSQNTTPSTPRGSKEQQSPKSRKVTSTPSSLQNGEAGGGALDISIEAREVEAILACRPNTNGSGSSSWGMWAALVVMEVVSFLWIQWALDIYGIYRAASA